MHRPWICVILAFTCAATALGQIAEGVEPTIESDGTSVKVPAGAKGADHLLRTLVLSNMPAEYENTKHWGSTKRVWDGLHISLDGLRLKTKRRWKDAKHGTWKRYRAWLIDPDEEFEIQLENMVAKSDGKTAFDVVIDARLGAWGRLSEYARDVQLVSISAEADARVQMRVGCEMSLRLDVTHFPPDFILEPQVVSAQLSLIDFRLIRISDFDGPLVREFGEELHDVLQDGIEEREAKLVAKINRQLKKHEDDLRLSISDLAGSGLRQVGESSP